MVVVFDSDVLIPLILPASRSTRLFARLTEAGHVVAASEPLLDEVREKLRTKPSVREWLALSDSDIERFLEKLPALCRVTPGLLSVSGAVPDDPKDDMVIAAAVESGALYLISEDKHLRKLKQWQHIAIMNRNEFMHELDRLDVAQASKE